MDARCLHVDKPESEHDLCKSFERAGGKLQLNNNSSNEGRWVSVEFSN